MRHGRITAALIIIIALGLGYGVATQLDAFLGISFHDKDVPDESGLLPAHQASFPAIAPIAAIALPDGALADAHYREAAEALAAAVAARADARPALVEAGALPAGRHIAVGAARPAQAPPVAAPAGPEAFTIAPYELDGAPHVAVVGGSRRGELHGMYRLAAALWAGTEEAALFAARTEAPALPLRFVDFGAVGMNRDPAAWDPSDYSHSMRAFEHAILDRPPFVDPARFDAIAGDFRAYLQRMLSYGNNGVVLISNMLQLVNFDRVGDGNQIYPQDSVHRQRQVAMREHFGRLFQIAEDMDMDVVLSTDMVALTAPLEAYFQRRFGGIDVQDPAFWEVYRLGLEELFDTLPQIDGVMIRIGEAGAIYNVPGWDYRSALHVRTDEAVRTMLQAFIDVATPRGKRVYFRTWSVGIGKIGDMHTNPATYERVLGPLDAPGLVVSTKLIMGDYDSYLPLNPTLQAGAHPRLVEMQARREFEGFNAFPNYLGPLHQVALQRFLRANPHITGAWTWNQFGGPQHAGPMSLYPFHGFWLLIDANTYASSHLAWDPDADLGAITRAWVRQRFGTDPGVVSAITEILQRSREAVRKGFYIGPYARKQVRALGLEPPPMMWIFKWDIVGGDAASLAAIYFTARGELDLAIAEGFQAVDVARAMRDLAAGLDPGQVSDPALLARLVASLDYEVDLFTTLAWYRRVFLRYHEWLDTGAAEAWRDWQEARARFAEHEAAHRTRYGEDLDFPAFNFFAADIGQAHATRTGAVAWVARGLLVVVLLLSCAGCGPVARRLPAFPGKRGLRALWCAWTAPFRAPDEDPGPGGDAGRSLVAIAVYALLTASQLIVSSYLSPGARAAGGAGGRGLRARAAGAVPRPGAGELAHGRGRGRVRAHRAAPGREHGARPGALLDAVLDRSGLPPALRHRLRGRHGVGPVRALRGRARVAGPAPRPGAGPPRARARGRDRVPGRAAGSARPRARDHNDQRPDGHPAPGAVAHPRHHHAPRHSAGAAVVPPRRGRRAGSARRARARLRPARASLGRVEAARGRREVELDALALDLDARLPAVEGGLREGVVEARVLADGHLLAGDLRRAVPAESDGASRGRRVAHVEAAGQAALRRSRRHLERGRAHGLAEGRERVPVDRASDLHDPDVVGAALCDEIEVVGERPGRVHGGIVGAVGGRPVRVQGQVAVAAAGEGPAPLLHDLVEVLPGQVGVGEGLVREGVAEDGVVAGRVLGRVDVDGHVLVLQRARHGRLAVPVAAGLGIVAPVRGHGPVAEGVVGEHDGVGVEGRLPGVRLVRGAALAIVVHGRGQHDLGAAPGIGVDLAHQGQVDHDASGGGELLGHDRVGAQRLESGDQGELRVIPEIVGVHGLEGEGQHRPGDEGARAPPDRQVVGIGVVEAVGRLGGGLVGQAEPHVDAHALAVDEHLARARHPQDGLGILVAPGAGEEHAAGVAGPGVRIAGGVEEHLGDVPGVLVPRGHLVFLVRSSVRDAEGRAPGVQRHVEEQDVEHAGRAGAHVRVGGVLDQGQERGDVLLIVDVGVPLAEAQAGAQVEPAQQAGLGVGAMLGAGLAIAGEHGVGVGLAHQVFDRVEHHEVVLGPVVAVVLDALGRGLGLYQYLKSRSARSTASTSAGASMGWSR